MQSFFAAKNSKVEQAGAPPRSAREKAEPPGVRFFSAAPGCRLVSRGKEGTNEAKSQSTPCGGTVPAKTTKYNVYPVPRVAVPARIAKECKRPRVQALQARTRKLRARNDLDRFVDRLKLLLAQLLALLEVRGLLRAPGGSGLAESGQT